MKLTLLFGSPRQTGNTAALLVPFLEECAALGFETERIDLYGRDLAPCLGCMACQDRLDDAGCSQQDDFQEIFRAVQRCDVLVLATPIYAWYCTAPMKCWMDRAVYAGTKNYGAVKGPALLAGKRVATVVTCGYPEQKGADLWEEGLKRWCKHGKMNYLGMMCRQDLGRGVPFLDEEKAWSARNFAQAIYLSVTTEEL